MSPNINHILFKFEKFNFLQDLEQLAAELQTVVRKYRIHDKYWTHLDYLWAKDLNKMLNHELVAHMSSLVNKYLR